MGKTLHASELLRLSKEKIKTHLGWLDAVSKPLIRHVTDFASFFSSFFLCTSV